MFKKRGSLTVPATNQPTFKPSPSTVGSSPASSRAAPDSSPISNGPAKLSPSRNPPGSRDTAKLGAECSPVENRSRPISRQRPASDTTLPPLPPSMAPAAPPLAVAPPLAGPPPFGTLPPVATLPPVLAEPPVLTRPPDVVRPPVVTPPPELPPSDA